MSAQVRVERTKTERAQATEEHVDAPKRTAAQEELIGYSDEVMAEIDAALEGLDQDLALQYVQKGGE